MIAEKYKYPIDGEEIKYWARRGAKSGAFLLVIPGCTMIALGVGMLTGPLIPLSIIGFGTGLFVWGLIVALTN